MRRCLAIFLAILLSGCNSSKWSNQSTGGRPNINGHTQAHSYGNIFIPTISKLGNKIVFLAPDGKKTGIEYDLDRLVNTDIESGYSVTGTASLSETELEKTESLINCAITSAFAEGFYANYEKLIKSEDYNSEFPKFSIGLPVECEVLHSGSLQQLFLVPLMYERRIIAVARVGKYKNEHEYSAISFSVADGPARYDTQGDGIIRAFSKPSVIKRFLEHPRISSLGINPATVTAKRVYVYTKPDITEGTSLAWLVLSNAGTFLVNSDGFVFKANGNYFVSSLGTKLPYSYRVEVQAMF